MDIKQLEFLAEKFCEMCRDHPEICPHDYQLVSVNTKERTELYVCSLCGADLRRTKKKR